MNPFEDLIPNQAGGANPFADLVGQPAKPTVGQKILNIGTKITDLLGGKAVAETFGAEIAKAKATPQEKQFITQPTLGQTAGSAIQLGATFMPVGGLAGGITSGARALGMKTGVSALGKIGSGALVGEVFDFGANLQGGKTGIEALKPGLGAAIGAGIPAVGVGLNVAGRAAKTVVPKLLSYTSDVPEKAFETMLQRREPVISAIKAGANPQTALKNTQGAVRDLRTTLTNDWQEGATKIAEEFKGKRLGLADKSVIKLIDLSDNFGFTIPQNPKNASVVEWINTLKSINELPKLTLTVSPKGNAVRTLKKDLMSMVVKTFGGEKGSVANLYKNYSAKKGVFDAANDIVKAYSTGKPIQQSTALNRLQTLFNENKPAYFEAILDLEKATGRDLLSEITASKFAQKLPLGGSTVSATTGILAPTGILDKAIKLLLAPLSSPRSAGAIARVLGKGGKLGAIQGPGDVILGTELGQSAKTALSDFVKNPKLGMSIKDVSAKQDVIAKVLSELDTSVPTVNGKIGLGAVDDDWFRLDQLKDKLMNKYLTNKDFIEVEKLLVKKNLLPKSNPTVGKTAVGETPLIQEAKKYKSAEEFVKATQVKDSQYYTEQINRIKSQPKTFGIDNKPVIDVLKKSLENVKQSELQKIKEITQSPVLSETQIKAIKEATTFDELWNVIKNENQDFIGMWTTKLQNVFPKNVNRMTKSQLTDIWNKANKK